MPALQDDWIATTQVCEAGPDAETQARRAVVAVQVKRGPAPVKPEQIRDDFVTTPRAV